MRIPLPELGIALLLAAGFAAVGECLLRRRSRGLAEANEAFLAGLGASAAALFPLTLAFPHRALPAVAIAIGGCLIGAAGSRFRRRREAPSPRSRDRIAVVMLAPTALVAAAFFALNFRYQYLWDGFLIWATKAQLLTFDGGLTRQWLVREDTYDLRHLAYPNAVPLYESLVALLRGGFDFDRLKPVFAVFYLSLLIGTYSAARARVSARLAALATLLVSLVPAISTGPAAGAYADMPQAAIVAGVVSAGLGDRRRSFPWLVGALTTVKAEGLILAALACVAVLADRVLESRSLRVRDLVRGTAVVAAFGILRVAYVRWIAAPELAYGASLATAFARVPDTIRLCLRELLSPKSWGLFWPAFLLSTVAVLRRGSPRERVLALATAASLGLSMAPFCFTLWPLELQIQQAYFRLAAQVCPAAAVTIVLAYARMAALSSGDGPELAFAGR